MSQNRETEFEKGVREGRYVREKILQSHIDTFNQGGGEKPVKVMPTGIDQQQVSGFFTQQKCILGKTAQQMEHDLGLKPNALKNGATIYELSETPNAQQFVPAGYTHMPGGRYYEEGQEYKPAPGVIQFRLNEPVPAKVIGKVGYEEPWKGPSVEQGIGQSSPSPDTLKTPSNEEVSESVGEIAGNVAGGPVGGEAGKAVGEAASKAQEEAMQTTGQSMEDPVNSSEEEQDQDHGYGYGY
jgi:hypothetical protein